MIFITPKSSGNAAIGKAVALGFLFLLVALGDDFFAQANTVGLEVEERASGTVKISTGRM